ncbi:hypothetical protein [Deinococcus aluminii]|uniref:tRNA-guanine(15) transglycosylase-like domain-containing protein n=1 Tax=Deinococcus aluminii TaxID=1656885 RepID=A0ABP9XGR3_9DEIO
MPFIPALSPRFELDRLLTPSAARLAPALLHSAAELLRCSLPGPPPYPLWLDSGGYAALDARNEVREEAGLGVLRVASYTLTPQSVLHLAVTLQAAVTFTLDFPSPDPRDKARRDALSLANARWTLAQPRPCRVYACLQPGQDPGPLLELRPDGIALGGLAPHAANLPLLREEVTRVRRALPEDLPLHVFGIGRPEALRCIRDAGATSADSASPQRTAVGGRTFDGVALEEPSLAERLNLAVRNLRLALEAL